MAKYDQARQEVDDSTERVRTLVREGKHEEAAQLADETRDLIKTLPQRDRASRRAAVDDALTGPGDASVEVAVPAELSDWREAEGAESLVDEASDAFADGVRRELSSGEFAEALADKILRLRLLFQNKKGVPDLLSSSQASKMAAREVYRKAGEGFEDNFDTKEALTSLVRKAQNRMSDVMVGYIRSLDENHEEYENRYPLVAAAYPDLSPSEAVWTFYENIGYRLPRKGRRELEREKYRLRQEALSRGEEPQEEGQQKELDPETTLSTSVLSLRNTLRETEKHLDVLAGASEEVRTEVRETAMEAVELAKKIIPATM